jgi:2'-hydroxyisoflavone reductase
MDPASEDVQAHYGPLKALCEEVVTDAFGERALVIHSGLIVGPFDPTGRFTYWALRLSRGGEVLGPGNPERHVQVAWVPDQFLLDEGGQPYTEMPLWVPASIGNLNMPIERALDAGLHHRGIDETLRDTRLWAESLSGTVGQIDAGGRVRRPIAITAEREAELLERWRARTS